MRTIAYKMFLKPGKADEYKRRHKEVWPELESITRASGVVDYHIYLDEETLTLFVFQSFDEDKQLVLNIDNHPVVKKWWRDMAPILESNADHTPVVEYLDPVYSLKH